MKTILHKVTIPNIRIDKMLSEATSLSRTRIKELIKEEMIFVNDHLVDCDYKLKIDEIIKVNIPEVKPYNVTPSNRPLNIQYEDADVLIINKESGISVHPSNTSKEDTLVNVLLYHINDLSGINGIMRPGIVHRIDKDTSGLLMIAKNDTAHQSLVKQLANKTVTRKYYALVYGHFDHQKGRINAPIGRDPKNRIKMCVIEGGKEAITNFSIIKEYQDYSLIECVLETGRTHQIRVHMEYIKHPIVGDPVYGPKKVIGNNGQFLHAKTIGFIHPSTNQYMEFDSELPNYFTDFLKSIL